MPLLQPKLTPLRRHLSTAAAAAAIRHHEAANNLFTSIPLLSVSPAAESIFHVAADVSSSPELISSYAKPGQYVQLRIAREPRFRPTFLAIASPPSTAERSGVFEFLVKAIRGSTAERLCGLGKGDEVELSFGMGKGFQLDKIEPPESCRTVLIFATGTGISPIRSLIEAGFDAKKRSEVRLYYGARNLKRMAYKERFKDWASYGINVVPVLSQPDNTWTGHRGFVQAAFARDKQILNPQSTGAVLCGHRQMAEEVTSLLIDEGVSEEKILKNI